MKALEVPNLPDDVYEQIMRRARATGISVGELAGTVIVQAIAHDDEAEARLMAELRAEREQMAKEGIWITDKDICPTMD